MPILKLDRPAVQLVDVKTQRVMRSFSDELKDLAQYCNDVNVDVEVNGRFVERYKRGHLAAHIHFSLFARGGRITGEYCAIAEAPVLNGDVLPITVSDASLPLDPPGSDQGEPSVLIDVFELIQDPERIEIQRLTGLCAVVRLHRIDECRRLFGDSAQAPNLVDLPPITLAGITNRKHGLVVRGVGRAVGIRQDQLIDQVVQRGAHVVDAVSDEQIHHGRWGRQDRDHVGPLRFKIYLGTGCAFVAHEVANSPRCTFLMLISPDEFSADAGQGTGVAD